MQQDEVFEQPPAQEVGIIPHITRHRIDRQTLKAKLLDHISEHRAAAKQHNDEVHRAQEAMYELGLMPRPSEPAPPAKPKFYFSRRNPLITTMIIVGVGSALLALAAAL